MANGFIGNTLKKLTTPFGGLPVKQSIAPASQFKTAAPTTTAPKPAVQAPATQAYTPPTQQPTQVKGLVSPNAETLNSLKTGLMNVQSGLDTLKQREAQPLSAKNPQMYGNIVSSLAEKSTTPSQLTQDATKAYQEAVQRKSQFQQNLSDTLAANRLNPIPLEFRQGREQVIQQAAAEKLAALQGAVQEAQAGVGFGQAQQGLEQSALSTAAGLVPEALRYGAFGDQELSPQNRAQQLAQQVKNLQITPQQAEAQMSSLYGGVGATYLNQALQGGGYNYITGGAQAQSLASNTQQQQTAGVDIARQGLQNATQDYVSMTGAAQFAGQQSQAVSQILQSTGLNDVSSTDYNRAINTIRGRFSDTDFRTLETALQEAQFAYAQLLSTGGSTPTSNDNRAINTLRIDQSASAINASIKQLEDAVARRLQAQSSIVQQYNQNLGTGAGQYQQPNSYAQPTGNSIWSW